MTLLEDIRDTIRDLDLTPERTRFTHPQYIEGCLYLTKNQWNTFMDEYFSSTREERGIDTMWFHHEQSIGEISGIPVIILEPGVLQKLPSGNYIFHNPPNGAIFTVDAERLRSYPYMHTYTPLTEEPQESPHNYSALPNLY